MANYDRLTALDSSFLYLEKSNAYTHIASTQIFDAGPLRMEDGGIDFEAIKKAHAAILHRIPRYRQVLKWIPFSSQPVWVDDSHFDLDFHVRHTSLPRPGTDEQLKRLSARVMQQHLDRSHPLWESWVVEGLEGDRFALISKVHHCMIDGISGVEILQLLLSPQPDAELPTPKEFVPRPTPSSVRLLRDNMTRRAMLPIDVFRDLRTFASEVQDLRREVITRARSLTDALGGSFRSPSQTPINQRIGAHRRFDWQRMSIAEIKQIRRKLGGSLNDVVLTIVTGAFRRFLSDRGVSLPGLDFRVLAPVSVRSEAESGHFGNRVSAWVIRLPLAEPDPQAQLAAITEITRELKESKQALGADLITQMASWAPSTLLSLGARNATRLLPFNTITTNVPGPQFPMYLLGAQMREVYPHVPLVDHLGLSIALLSYDGYIHWGVNADRETVPDLASFIDAINKAFQDLRRRAGLADDLSRAAN